mmetsp:Transcript_31239/g.77890  ORF Transcript_31239/g.77890 Transcript_31239/m.77890 type:complete len:239 (-) Transcript_31239:396-1112(-)
MQRAVPTVSRLFSHPFLRSRHAASAAEWVRTSRRAVCSKAEEKSVAATAGGKSLEKKIWGSGLELEPVTKEQAEEKYLDVTDLKRTLTPPTSVAVKARDDMLNDRFNYVSTHLSNENAYIVAGKKGAVAPAAVGQTGMALASFCVLMGAITSVVYIKTQWGVTSAKDLGDKLREKGAARREALEASGTVGLVRSISSKGEATVKEHVELVRRPSQQLGEHLDKSFKGVHRKRAEEPSP